MNIIGTRIGDAMTLNLGTSGSRMLADTAIGAVLFQLNKNHQALPILYFSQQLNASQKRWHITHKEAYAAFKAAKSLLWGGPIRLMYLCYCLNLQIEGSSMGM